MRRNMGIDSGCVSFAMPGFRIKWPLHDCRSFVLADAIAPHVVPSAKSED